MKEKLDKVAESFLGSKKSRDIISRRFRINVSDPLKKLKNKFTGDQSKKNVYRKTMGFVHKDTTSAVEDLSRSVKAISSKVKGESNGSEMSNLSRFGNASKYSNDPFARKLAKRKLVKGT